MMLYSRPARVLRTIVTVILPIHKPVPIGSLPSELLEAIFQLLEFSHRNTLWSCMQVCKGWHDVARPHFFATVPVEYHHREHFSYYVCARPEIAKNVKVVRFYDKSWPTGGFESPAIPPGPIDIQLLVSTLPLLTNVQELSLAGFKNRVDSSSPSQSPAPRGGPVFPPSLRRLSLTNCPKAAFIFLCVFSLFTTLDTLEVVLDAEYTRNPAELFFLNPPSVLNLPAIPLQTW